MMGARYDTRKRPEIPWRGGTGESPLGEDLQAVFLDD